MHGVAERGAGGNVGTDELAAGRCQKMALRVGDPDPKIGREAALQSVEQRLDLLGARRGEGAGEIAQRVEGADQGELTRPGGHLLGNALRHAIGVGGQ